MATASEQDRARKQRRGMTAKARRRRAARKSRAEKLSARHATEHARRKATYALEPVPQTGTPSRKSTRASANRRKADTNLNLREEMQKGSPESRFGKARAKSVRVRGAPAR